MKLPSRISIIAAFDNNRLIGADGKLPWDRIPADMERFRRLTAESTVIMGRRTHESIGKPLKGRINIVVTRNIYHNFEGCFVSLSFDAALKTAAISERDVFVIGGASIYQQALQVAGVDMRMYLTRVNAAFEGDTYFPVFDPQRWEQIDHALLPKGTENEYTLNFMTFKRKL